MSERYFGNGHPWGEFDRLHDRKPAPPWRPPLENLSSIDRLMSIVSKCIKCERDYDVWEPQLPRMLESNWAIWRIKS